jgi:leader peptidase (prepilin peptidase)/N-methyltransferase
LAPNAIELPASLTPWIVAWAALVGACLGSFLNVVIARVPRGESVAWPGSRCPRCRAPIRWYDNVPVVSWLVLRARCRSCRAPISARYPLVEAIGVAAAIVAYARHGLALAGAAELAFVAGVVALAFIDLDTWLLPNAITWSLLAFGVVMGPLGFTPAATLRFALYGAGIGFAAFAVIAVAGEKVLKKEALGFGDVWLLAALGAWFGPAPLLPIVMLASIQGSIVGIALVAMGKGQPGPPPAPPPEPLPAGGEPSPSAEAETPTSTSTEPHSSTLTAEDDWVPPRNAVPFGPCLVAGALEWLWLGNLLVGWIPMLRVFR